MTVNPAHTELPASIMQQLFPRSYHSASDRKSAVQEAALRGLDPVVRAALQAQNPGSPVIEELGVVPCAMVVTGQQLGVLGGPLLTLYKIVSAIKLSRTLEAESGMRVIPVFWLQSEDHDYEEIRRTTFLTKEQQLVEISLSENPVGLGGPVGRITIDEASARAIVEILQHHFGDSADHEVLSLLASAYAAGNTLSQSIATLLRNCFTPHGLLVLDAHTSELKSFARPLFERFFTDHEHIAALLEARAALLATHGKAVTVPLRKNYPLPFLEFNGKRERVLAHSGSSFKTSAGIRVWEDLRTELAHDPLRYSSSALARPLFQDFLLPTAAYVGGVAELSYWSQISDLYDFFRLRMPLVVPRNHFALLPHRLQALLESEQLCIEDLALSNEVLVSKRLGQSSASPEELFVCAESEINSALQKLAERIQPHASSALDESVALTKNAISNNLSKLKGRYLRVLTERESTFVGRITRLKNALYPRGLPQERVLSFAQLLLSDGVNAIERLIAEADPLPSIHAGMKILPLGR